MNNHFIPVIINRKAVNEVLDVLQKNINRIADDLNIPKSNFHLLNIRI